MIMIVSFVGRVGLDFDSVEHFARVMYFCKRLQRNCPMNVALEVVL